MIKIISFNELYLPYFKYNGVERHLAKGLDVKEIARGYSRLGPSYMAIEENIWLIVLAMGGIFPIFNNIGQAWLFFNKEAKEHKVIIFKAIKNYLASITKDYNFKQVQLIVLENSFESKNLVEHLGFKKKELWRRFVI